MDEGVNHYILCFAFGERKKKLYIRFLTSSLSKSKTWILAWQPITWSVTTKICLSPCENSIERADTSKSVESNCLPLETSQTLALASADAVIKYLESSVYYKPNNYYYYNNCCFINSLTIHWFKIILKIIIIWLFI